MSRGKTASQINHPVITNLKEYLRLKEIRNATSLIGGEIIYNGRVWNEQEYDALFPIPRLTYDIENPDKTHVQK